jgi:hypothetical protein
VLTVCLTQSSCCCSYKCTSRRYSQDACPLDRLKRDVFTFYLLLDCDFNEQGGDGMANGTAGPSTAVARTNGGTETEGRAAKFARKRCMPKHWQSFVKGYWAVDHGMWEVSHPWCTLACSPNSSNRTPFDI